MTTTATKPRARLTSFEEARAQLLGWGGLMLAIYILYLIFFPLIPYIYEKGPALDIEFILRRGEQWFAPIYLLGLFALFYAFYRCMKIVHTLSQQDADAANRLRVWVIGIGAVCGIVLVGLYPITALDVVLYVVRARLWALYGGSPLIALPVNFPNDPYVAFAGEFNKEASPYGPVWEMVAQIPLRLGLLDIGAGVIAMKVISLISYLMMTWLIGWHARQDTPKYSVSGLTAMTFFALNPMVLIQAMGNGHNDMLMLALMTLGLVLWQRDKWAWATVALTLATLVKITGLILLPLFGMALLQSAPTWRARIRRAFGVAAIFLILAGVTYRIAGPFPEVFTGMTHALTGRTGFAPASAIRMVLREIYPRDKIAPVPRNMARDLFVVYYTYLLIKLAQGRTTLIEAGFMAYFSQLLLGSTFRIWYPMWILPFAAMRLTSRMWWRSFLFSLTAELSILSYFILWRWILRSWDWGVNSPLKPYWNYFTIMNIITVPWTFAIPLLGPILRKRKDPARFDNSLWI